MLVLFVNFSFLRLLSFQTEHFDYYIVLIVVNSAQNFDFFDERLLLLAIFNRKGKFLWPNYY